MRQRGLQNLPTRPLRRIALFATLVCVLASGLEAGVPELHHGATAESRQAALAVTPPDADAGAPLNTPTDASHPVHLDHCTHTHVFAGTTSAAVAPWMVRFAAAAVRTDELLRSITTDPQVRPPIQ